MPPNPPRPRQVMGSIELEHDVGYHLNHSSMLIRIDTVYSSWSRCERKKNNARVMTEGEREGERRASRRVAVAVAVGRRPVAVGSRRRVSNGWCVESLFIYTAHVELWSCCVV